MKGLHLISIVLLILGGLNWLLVGLTQSDLGARYLTPELSQILYILVGLAAIYEIFTHKKNCKLC